MKKFLRYGFLFFGFVLAISLPTIYLINGSIETNDFYQLDEGVASIVVGDSHPECALNDSLIDNFQNFAQSGESYFYSYLKIKEIVEHNSSLKTVYIEFNNGQIIKNINLCIWDDIHLSAKYPKYSIAMDWGDYWLLMKNNLSGTLNAQTLSLNQNLSLLKNENRSMHSFDWGRYKSLTNDASPKLDSLIGTSIEMDSTKIKYSQTNIDYLLKAIRVCEDHNVEVILIRSPVHANYLGRTNEFTFQYLRNKFLKDQTFLDFKDFELTNSQFADKHHLNNTGAKSFSIYFNETVNSKLSD